MTDVERTPERVVVAASTMKSPYAPSPASAAGQQQGLHVDPAGALPAPSPNAWLKQRDTLRSVCGKLTCSMCKAPSSSLMLDGPELRCPGCASDSESTVLPAILLEAISEVRTAFAEAEAVAQVLQATSRPRVRAKGRTPERPLPSASPVVQASVEGGGPTMNGGLAVNPNPNVSPVKPPASSTSVSSAEDSATRPHSVQPRPPALPTADSRALEHAEGVAREEVHTAESQTALHFHKTLGELRAGVAKARDKETSRKFKAEGDRHYESGSYDTATNFYTKAIELNDGTTSLAALLGNRSASYFMLRAWEQCIQDCRDSVEAQPSPNDGEAAKKQKAGKGKLMQRAAKAAYLLGDLPAAAKLLGEIPTEVRSPQQEEERVRFEQGAKQIASVSTMGPAEALEALRMLVADFHEAAPLRLMLAQRYMAAGSYARAYHTLELIPNPKTDVHVAMAKSLYMQGFERVPEAIKVLEGIASESADAQRELAKVSGMELGKQTGNSLFSSSKFAESVEHYTTALQHAEDVPNIRKILFCNRAASYKEMKRYREGADDCSKAIAIDPNFGKAYTRRARCLLALDCFTSATRDFTTAIKLIGAPDSSETRGLEHELRGVERAEKALLEKEKDFYWLLDLQSSASERDIKKQYKVLSLKWHPDKCMHLSEDERLGAERRFKKISEAYATLTDDSKRREYDLRRARSHSFRGGLDGADAFRYPTDGAKPRYNPPPPGWRNNGPTGKFWS